MDRLRDYFIEAQTCSSSNRHFGIELETLFVNKEDNKPISLQVSQKMMQDMVCLYKWQVIVEYHGFISEITNEGYCLKYDVGWNLFELTTPAVPVLQSNNLFATLAKYIKNLYSCAEQHNAVSLKGYCDNNKSNTLIPATELEELYLELNGNSLTYLGHIAAIHYNIDLTSVQEGMSWISILETMYANQGWPPPESQYYWNCFLQESEANYEPQRYGPAPQNFEEYLSCLSNFKVFLNKVNNKVFLETPPPTFKNCFEVDLNWFVTFVWWWTRLRVRNNKLVLEIRAVPRGNDSEISLNFNNIRSELRF